jgi:hypothetical protein
MRNRFVIVAALLAFLGTACGTQGEDPEASAPAAEDISLSLGTVPETVKGNVVTLPVTVEGIEIAPADGDTSGDTGHFHVFVDGEPVGAGETMPVERGVVHSAENPIKVWGLQPGDHTFDVVVGNGAHERIGDVEDSVSVKVEGPGVQGTAPATAKVGEDVVVELASQGVEIKPPDGDRSGKTGHYHVYVDPATPPKAGDVVPAAVENKIFHTPESSVTIKELAAGAHIIWIALGDGTHTLVDPPVMDKITVTVS